MRSYRRRRSRGVAPIIATVILVGITVVAAAILYAFRPPYPTSTLSLTVYTSAAGSEPAWGDLSDCQDVNGVQTCQTLPVIDVIFVNPPPVLLTNLEMVFFCNGSVYLAATLAQIEWIPGNASSPTSGPTLGTCAAFTPPRAYWNRFAFFDQITPGVTVMQPGDILVFYAHTFTTFKDDDFHGAPLWCYSTPGACYLDIFYTGTPPSLAVEISLFGLYS